MYGDDIVKDIQWGTRPAKYVTNVYSSLDELADAAERRGPMMSRKWSYLTDGETNEKWTYGGFYQTVNLCRNGWERNLDRVIDIAEHAVQAVMAEHNTPAPLMQYDVAGDFVDVGRYLSGEPECMVDFPIQETSKVGKVVTLIASVDCKAGASADHMYRRGIGITAFAMALTRLGHSVEFWVDVFCNDPRPSYGAKTELLGGYVRALVKGPNDTLDPSKLLFAYCHSGVMRHLGMAVTHGWPKTYIHAMDMGYGYGPVGAPPQDMEDGTIYLPAVQAHVDLSNPSELITHYLTTLGLLAE